MEEYVELLLCSSNIKLSENNDKRIWKLEKKRSFSVKSYYEFITMRENNKNQTAPFKQIWKSKAPPKIDFFYLGGG